MKANNLTGFGNNRVENDFYATDPKSVEQLLNNHEFDYNGTIWEPCAGAGHITNVLKESFKSVYSSDLVDRDQGFDCFDFLKYKGSDKFDYIITNPPFKNAKEFIEKSLLHTNKGVAMFLKIQFLEGLGRKEFLQKSCLKYVYVFSKRQCIFTNGKEFDENGKRRANTMCFAWFLWEHGYEGETMVKWI